MSAQLESRFLSLDEGSRCHILSCLELRDLAAVAQTCNQLRTQVIQAAHPLYAQLLRKHYPGLEYQGGHAALPVMRALRSQLSEAALSKHTTDAHIRYQAVYTDGGVDENLYSQFWCDKAFQCNGWGAFCSKISPHVHVLGLLKSHSRREQLIIQLRLVCAELCKWAAGRLLARVPLPAPCTRLTARQHRFFSKAGASLLRWHFRGLFRMFCVLYRARMAREVLGQTLELGVALGEFAPGTHVHKALQAVFGPQHPLCIAQVALPPLANPSYSTTHQEHQPTGSTPLMAALQLEQRDAGRGRGAGAGTNSRSTGNTAASSSNASAAYSAADYTQLLLDSLYAVLLPYTELPVAAAGEAPVPAAAAAVAAILAGVPQAMPAPPPPSVPLPAELLNDVADAQELLQHTAQDLPALGADLRPQIDVSADPTGLHALDVMVATRFERPHQLASVASIMDMVAISRAGNFTCPLRTGALFYATLTSTCLAPQTWLAQCADRGEALHPYRQIPPTAGAAAANPSRGAALGLSEPVLARDLLARLKQARQSLGASSTQSLNSAAYNALFEVEVEVTRAYCQAITSQACVTQLNNMTCADQVFAAVRAGKLPRILQYKLLLNAEVIEFEPQASSAAADTTTGGWPLAHPPVPMQPLIWFRFFTKPEVQGVNQVYKFHTQGNNPTVTPASKARQVEPWGTLSPAELKSYSTKLTRKWHQRQERKLGEANKNGRKGKKPKQAEPRVPPTPEQLQSVVPQQLMVMNPAGNFEPLDVTGCLHSPVSLEQYAWGAELLKAQQELLQQPDVRQTRSRSRGADLEGASSDDWDAEVSSILHESDDSDVMGTDSSELDAQLDNMHEDEGPLNVEPPVDVQQLLDMMGYEQMDVDGDGEPEANGNGDAAAGGGLGDVPEPQLESSDSGSYEDDTSDYSSDVEDSDGSSGAESDDEGSEGEGMDYMMLHGGTSSDDDFSDSEDMVNAADYPDLVDVSVYTDLVDDSPPTSQEHSLVVLLSGLVGLEPLTQSHLELEKEASSIIDEGLLEKHKAKAAAVQAFGEAYMAEEAQQGGTSGGAAAAGEEGSKGGKQGQQASKRAKGGKAGAGEAAGQGGNKEGGRAKRGKKKGEGAGKGMQVDSTQQAHQLAERGPLVPYPQATVEFLPGDETAKDSIAFKPLVSSHDMRNQPGMLQLRLLQPRAANMVVLKLISPEDLMTEMDDPHSDPNVDVQFVAFRGRAFKLPEGVQPHS